MPQVRQPKFRILYNKKDITADVSPYLVSLTYKDEVESKSDEVQLELSDTTGIWMDEWYPTLGDTLDVYMGYETQMFHCGTFEIDEIEYKFGPDIINLKGIAAGIKDAVRQKRSDQHENKTLRQIAKKVADRYGFSLSGNIQDTGQISRVTQALETDLCFLKRLSQEYGHVFSIRGNTMVFTNIYQLESIVSAVTVTREDLQPGSFIKDKSYDTYKKLHLLHFDPNSKNVLETEFEFPAITNVDGFTYNGIVKKDVKEVRVRFDNGHQGHLKAIAALHSGNSKQQEGSLLMIGNPFVLSGNNMTLVACGKLSGDYHVMASTHKITKGGYQTDARTKRVGYVNIEKTKRKKVRKPQPVHVNVVR